MNKKIEKHGVPPTSLPLYPYIHINIYIRWWDIFTVNALYLAHAAGHIKVLHTSQDMVLGALSQSTLRKARPDLARVGATRQGRVSVQDGVTGQSEVGVTRLPR